MSWAYLTLNLPSQIEDGTEGVFQLPQKVTELGGGVNFCLVRILALAENGCGHDVVAVFCADQVCRLEEDGSPVGIGKLFPFRFGCEGGIDGGGNVPR